MLLDLSEGRKRRRTTAESAAERCICVDDPEHDSAKLREAGGAAQVFVARGVFQCMKTSFPAIIAALAVTAPANAATLEEAFMAATGKSFEDEQDEKDRKELA